MSKNINVETDRKSSKSIFEYYRKLIALRKTYDVIRDGDFTILDENSSETFIYKREDSGESLYVICNLNEEEKEINKEITERIKKGRCIITNVDFPCENGKLKSYEASVWLVKN